MSGARNRAVIRRLLHTYTAQLLLQTQEEAQLKINLEAEKVLCDMVLHQQYLDSMTAALAAQQQTSPPNIPALLRTVRSAGIAGCKHQQANGEQQQQQQLPDSYSARLLRQASADEVSVALSRSDAEWAEVFSSLFYKLLAHLELCARSEYDYDPTSSCSIRGAPAPAGQPAQCSCQHAAAAQRGTCGCAAQAQLQKTVDDTARAFLLAWVLNHTVVGASVTMRVDGTGPSEPAAPEHWEQVVDRLQLTETQELHISICFKEFKRLMGSISAEAGCLIKCVEEPTVQLAAALRELSVAPSSEQRQQQQQPRGAPAQSSTLSAASRQDGQEPAGWLGAGCGAWHERVALRLQEHVRWRLFVHVSVIAFVFNTLSTQQLALMCVASFPWQTSLVYLTEIISRRAQERQERQLRQQVGSRGSDASHHARSTVAGDSSDGAEHAAPAAAAGDGGGRDSGEHEQGELPYWRWQLQQLQEQRAAELALHQRVCWAQLGCGPANEGEQIASADGGPSEGAAAAPCDAAQQQQQH